MANLTILRLTLLPFAAGIIGGIVAALHAPGPRIRSAIQYFAAGVVFAAVAGELLHDVRH